MRSHLSSAPVLLALLAGCTPSPEPADRAAGQPASAAASSPAATSASASTTGVIESIDPEARTLTISHEPVASLQWPAMTMGFKAPDADLSALQAGDRIRFEFTASGMDATITRIEPVE
jgi:Cu(I)/Ag(I) efflux system periplasmic protein CusF